MTLPDADEKLNRRCKQAADQKYGTPLPEVVDRRLELELKAIEANHSASEYYIGATVAEQSRNNGFPVSSRGTIGSSLVAHLCGISQVNPLPAHYRCPRCCHFEIVDNTVKTSPIIGYDLPDKECPVCKAEMMFEGADIEPEICMGRHLDRDPDIILNVAAEIRPKLFDYIRNAFPEVHVYRAGTKAVRKNGTVIRGVHPGGVFILPKEADITELTPLREKTPDDEFRMRVTEQDYHLLWNVLKKYDLLVLPEIEMIYTLEKYTGFPARLIKTNDMDTLNVFLEEGFSFLPSRATDWKEAKELQEKLIQELKPCGFSDLARISAVINDVGAWEDNGEILAKTGKGIGELIVYRDDIMQFLLAVGLTRTQAFDIMDHVRKGKGITDSMAQKMEVAGVPKWYIESCRRVRYLYPKAHAVEYMLIYWKLAYYHRHFPAEYDKALDERLPF